MASANWCVSEEEAREAAGSYAPNLSEVKGAQIPQELYKVVDELERYIHDTWALGRMGDGWTWGPVRDDAKKQHPGLVPTECLSDEEREYDRATAEATVKFLVSRGFDITPPRK